MCGIIGYTGRSSSLNTVLDGLQRLEYRGYDSAGVAFHNGNGIDIFKTKGKIKDLQKILPEPVPCIKTALGHTRWATHGEPSSKNAHPHETDGVVVVHNGIIENYRELRSNLKERGHVFTSDTDTEVIPQLISKHIREGFSPREAIIKTLTLLKGSYALGIMCSHCPDMLFAIRKGSPMVIGIGNDDYYCASDIPAILPYTRRFLFLEDDYLCTLSKDGVGIVNLKSGEHASPDQFTVNIEWSPEIAEKSGFQHFMHKEIFEQPQAIMNTIQEWVETPRNIFEELGMSTKTVLNLSRLHIVACGTSYHAALIGRYMVERMARIPVDVEVASEYRYRNPVIENGTLFVSITQSGETADTLAAQREAKSRGARTLTICNVVGSSAAREADFALYTRAGLEIGVAATKTFTAQLSMLALLALFLGIKRGRVTEGEITAFKTFLVKIPSFIEKVILKDPQIRDLAAALASNTGFLYLGRGINFPIALEGALKLKEISYIHAEGYPAGEMKHGPIALIDKGTPVIVVVPTDDLFEKTLSNIEEVKARGGRVIAVTNEPSALKDKADDLIEVSSTHPALTPFVNVVPLQLLAYHIGVLNGCDVDQPRNLAKSVTVE